MSVCTARKTMTLHRNPGEREPRFRRNGILCILPILFVLFLLPVSSLSAQSAGDGAEEGQRSGTDSSRSAEEDREAVAPPEAGPGVPEETEFKLPETLLEVEELSVEEIRAELPESDDVPIRPIDVPLPEEGDLRVADSAFALPAPNETATAPEARDRSSYFASGVLGAGSMSHIQGALSLSKLGSDPRLRFQFSHEGLDGYNFEDAGTGFFQSETYIDGYAAGVIGPFNTEVSASFREHEEGLQTNPNYFSANLRFINASLAGRYNPSETVELGAIVNGTSANRLLTVKAADASPPRITELVLEPRLEGRFSFGDASLSTDIGYRYRAYDQGILGGQSLRVLVAGDAPITSELFVGGDVGLYWPIGSGVEFPFHVNVTATVDDLITLGLSAGYEAGPRNVYELWRNEPLVADLVASGREALRDRTAWVGDAELSWNVLRRRVVVAGGVGFDYNETALALQAYNAEAGLFPVDQEARTTVEPSLGVTYRGGALSTELSWTGSFIERSAFEPLHQLGLVVDVATENRGVTGSLSLESPFYESQALPPVINAEVGFRVVEGLRIVARVEDPVAPILDEGRPRYGTAPSATHPFITPGFRFAVSTEISL